MKRHRVIGNIDERSSVQNDIHISIQEEYNMDIRFIVLEIIDKFEMTSN